MVATIYHFPPKGSAWLVYHRLWKGGGCTTSWAFIFNETQGLTAYEAWQRSRLQGNPPFYEVIAVQLTPFPRVRPGAGSSASKVHDVCFSEADEAVSAGIMAGRGPVRAAAAPKVDDVSLGKTDEIVSGEALESEGQ